MIIYCNLASFDFGHILSVSTIHFETKFCANKKGGVGGGGQVSARDAMRRAAALAGFRMALVGTGWTFSHLASTNRCRDTSLFIGTPFPKGSFQSNGAFTGKKALAIESLLKSACGQGHESQHSGSKKLWLKFLVLVSSRSC